MKRNQPRRCGPNTFDVGVNAQPAAETRKSTPMSHRVGRRPHRSDGAPAPKTPITVPMSATETTNPCQKALRPNSAWMAFSHPEMTPESKPKRKPPSAATITM